MVNNSSYAYQISRNRAFLTEQVLDTTTTNLDASTVRRVVTTTNSYDANFRLDSTVVVSSTATTGYDGTSLINTTDAADDS